MSAQRPPEFVLAGAPKSGTSSIHRMLAQHPVLFLPAVKEPHFFSRGFAEIDTDAYLRLFRPARSGQLRGEASTSYLADPATPGALARWNASMQIIAVLRQPVHQVVSMYLHNVRNGLEDLSLSDALAAEDERCHAGASPMLLYARRADYRAQLERYLAVFPRAQLGIWFYDDFAADPVASVREMYAWLGVDASFLPEAQNANRRGRPRLRALNRLLNKRGSLPWRVVRRLAPRWIKLRYLSPLRQRLRELNTRPQQAPAEWDELVAVARVRLPPGAAEIGELIGRAVPRQWAGAVGEGPEHPEHGQEGVL